MILLEQLVDNIADAGFAVDYTLKICAWNPRAEALLGFAREDVLGLPCYAIITGRDDEGNVFCRQHCSPLRCAKAGGLPPNYNICARTKGGRSLWLNTSIIVLPNPPTRGYLIHVFRSIDPQKRLAAFVQKTISEWVKLSANDPLPARHPSLDNSPLSKRELEILRLLGSGTSTMEIADTLGISRATVRTHTQNILRKLGLHSKLQAALYAAALQHLS